MQFLPQRNVQKWKMPVKSVQNYSFSCLNMQICYIHVAVLALFVYAPYEAPKFQRQRELHQKM